MLMAEMKKLRYVVLQSQGQQAQEEEIQPMVESPAVLRGPGRRSDWHYWGANWAAKNPDIPRDENFSLKMAEAYRAWKEAHPGQTYLGFRGTDVIDGRKRLTQKKGKKVSPAPPRQVTPLAPLRQATPTSRQRTPPLRQATPPVAPAPLPLRQATPPPSRQKTPNKYSLPSPGPLSTPTLLQGRRETPPQEYYELAEEEEVISPQQEQPTRVAIQEESVEDTPEEEQEVYPEEGAVEVSPEEGAVEVSPEEEEEVSPEEEEELSPEEEASILAAQQEEEEQPDASPEWPEEEQAEDGDLEIVTVGQQEYFRTSNNGLFNVIRDEEGNPDIGTWAGVLSDDGTQVVETEQPEAS